MQLTTKARYAVMAMVDLVESDAPLSIQKISEKQNLSQSYLEQLFLKLKKCGLVSSIRGAQGGYILSQQPKDIKIYDVICATDKPVKLTRCSSGKGCQSKSSKCKTHDLWAKLGLHMQDFLKNTSLEDVAKGAL